MSLEKKSGSTRRLDQSLKAQLKFDALVRAVDNGACGATYDGDSGETIVYSGELVDKDGFEELLNGYTSLIQETGVEKKAIKEVTSGIRTKFEAGTIQEQHAILNNLDSAVQGLTRRQPRQG